MCCREYWVELASYLCQELTLTKAPLVQTTFLQTVFLSSSRIVPSGVLLINLIMASISDLRASAIASCGLVDYNRLRFARLNYDVTHDVIIKKEKVN